MSGLWKKIEQHDLPRYLTPGDVCYHAREYIAGGGWQASEANQLILNFKKGPEKKATGEWYWKVRAIEQFAREVADLSLKDFCLVAIPTSKPNGHPQHDERFYLMLGELHRLRPKWHIEEPIVRAAPCQAQHEGGNRSIHAARRTMRWEGFEAIPSKGVFLIDDVLTWGTNFKACQQMIREHHPDLPVGGLFWARTIWL